MFHTLPEWIKYASVWQILKIDIGVSGDFRSLEICWKSNLVKKKESDKCLSIRLFCY